MTARLRGIRASAQFRKRPLSSLESGIGRRYSDVATVSRNRILTRSLFFENSQFKPAFRSENVRQSGALSFRTLQDAEGRWQPKLNPGTHTYNLTGGDNRRYIMNGPIWSGQRVVAVIEDL